MCVAMRLGVVVAALLSACTLDGRNKTGCNTTSDCLGGYTCNAFKRCVPEGSGVKLDGGNIGTADDGPPPRMCPPSAVTACPPAEAGTRCEETVCGGRVWQFGMMQSVRVRYRFLDEGMFSPEYQNAIRAGADAWRQASADFVTFQECFNCAGRFISIVPGDGDGITNPESTLEQFLPMPVVGSDGRVSPHRIAHQWGHALGLSHTYERADRDRYMRFDPETWCPPGLPPRCAAGPPGSPGLPALTTGTFGVFDEASKMNGFLSEGLCAAGEPDADSVEPTIGDISALAEMFFGVTAGWAPFRPIGRSVSPTQPLDYQLAPGVDPVGSPAIAEIESTYASPEIFVRGNNDVVYTTTRSDLLTTEWSEWTPVVGGVDGDPAAVFATLSPQETLFLAARFLDDGNLRLLVRRDGEWGQWKPLGAPPSGAASAPALASESPARLHVFVRGGDGRIYWLACTDASEDCDDSAKQPGAWRALPPPPSGIFVGKPSAVWWIEETRAHGRRDPQRSGRHAAHQRQQRRGYVASRRQPQWRSRSRRSGSRRRDHDILTARRRVLLRPQPTAPARQLNDTLGVLSYRRRARFASRRGRHLPWRCPDGRRRDYRRPRASRSVVAIPRRGLQDPLLRRSRDLRPVWPVNEGYCLLRTISPTTFIIPPESNSSRCRDEPCTQ